MRLIKMIIPGLLFLITFQVNAQEVNLWHSNFEEAKTLAAEQNRSILMVFSGSDWCKPCIQMREQIWDSAAFQNFAKENLVLLELDFPFRKKNRLSKEQTAHNEALAEQYNSKGEFPKVVLLDANGAELDRFGYDKSQQAQDYITYLAKKINHEQ